MSRPVIFVLRVLLGLLFITRVIASSDTAVATPSPISIAASQDWDGNDGPWSSFALQVGTPPQNVKVLIGTSALQSWVVVPEGCTPDDPGECSLLRGGEFLINASSTWIPNTANNNTNLYALDLETSLGYSGNGEYGFDTVTLGWQGSGGPSVKNQTVAGIATKDFYLGMFGLNPRPSNFTGFNDPVPSYIETLRNQSQIPSTSWAYTAGNRYRAGGVLGSLTLGGYDASRFISNDISFQFSDRDIRDLTVPITSIFISNRNESLTFLPSESQSSIAAFIDSSVPHIWLPESICTAFEEAFNLTYNTETSLYLLDEYQHNALLTMNPNITFTLKGSIGSVDITLPYAAFDLIASDPIIPKNSAYYFPIRRAQSEDQVTLGRVFLQEAYLIADYDRHNFSVSQCQWPTNTTQDIITIHPPSEPSSNSTHHRISKGLLIGIIIISIGFFLLLVTLSIIIYFKMIKPRFSPATHSNSDTNTHDDPNHTQFGTHFKPELDVGTPRHELYDSNPHAYGAEIEGQDHYIHEMDSKAMLVEADCSNHYYEMPANEEVGSELPSPWKK